MLGSKPKAAHLPGTMPGAHAQVLKYSFDLLSAWHRHLDNNSSDKDGSSQHEPVIRRATEALPIPPKFMVSSYQGVGQPLLIEWVL